MIKSDYNSPHSFLPTPATGPTSHALAFTRLFCSDPGLLVGPVTSQAYLGIEAITCYTFSVPEALYPLFYRFNL